MRPLFFFIFCLLLFSSHTCLFKQVFLWRAFIVGWITRFVIKHMICFRWYSHPHFLHCQMIVNDEKLLMSIFTCFHHRSSMKNLLYNNPLQLKLIANLFSLKLYDIALEFKSTMCLRRSTVKLLFKHLKMVISAKREREEKFLELIIMQFFLTVLHVI